MILARKHKQTRHELVASFCMDYYNLLRRYSKEYTGSICIIICGALPYRSYSRLFSSSRVLSCHGAYIFIVIQHFSWRCLATLSQQKVWVCTSGIVRCHLAWHRVGRAMCTYQWRHMPLRACSSMGRRWWWRYVLCYDERVAYFMVCIRHEL